MERRERYLRDWCECAGVEYREPLVLGSTDEVCDAIEFASARYVVECHPEFIVELGLKVEAFTTTDGTTVVLGEDGVEVRPSVPRPEGGAA